MKTPTTQMIGIMILTGMITIGMTMTGMVILILTMTGMNHITI